MKPFFEFLLNKLPMLLALAALGQAIISMINLGLVPLLGWKKDLAAMPLLVREVFMVHQWFITVTLLLFAFWTWLLIPLLAPGARLAGSLCLGISIFWGIRSILQVSYYSSSHWKGNPGRTLVHAVLLLAYGSCSIVYGCAAWVCLEKGWNWP